MHVHEMGACMEKAQACTIETSSSQVQGSVQSVSIHSLISQMRRLRETKTLA